MADDLGAIVLIAPLFGSGLSLPRSAVLAGEGLGILGASWLTNPLHPGGPGWGRRDLAAGSVLGGCHRAITAR